MSDDPMRILVVEPTKDPYVKEIDGSLASIVGVSTHSFRKWYAAEIYKANGFDIALVSAFYSTAPPPLHSVTSALSRKELKPRFRDTHSFSERR